MKSIEEQLILHEGIVLHAYEDTEGYLTIGCGRMIDQRRFGGISLGEALILLRNDIADITERLQEYGWYRELDLIRQKVIIDMAFNLGLSGLLSFKNMVQALNCYDYDTAADEMVNSRWYEQVGQRGRRLVEMMRTGEDYTDKEG